MYHDFDEPFINAIGNVGATMEFMSSLSLDIIAI